MDVFKDRVRVLGFLQGLPFLNPLEPIIHPVQNVPDGPFAGQLFFLIASIEKSLSYFGGGQVGVLPLGLQFWIRMCVRFDNQSNVDGQLRVSVFAPSPTATRC